MQPDNRDDGIPFIQTVKGWGLFWNNTSVTTYDGTEEGFGLASECGDAGDGYGYEQGEYTETVFRWDDAARTLTVEARKGAYPGMLAKRRFRVRIAGDAAPEKAVDYDGRTASVRF